MIQLLSPAEYDLPKELSVSFTGHRPDRLPWGADERDERCADFKSRLGREIKKAYGQGARYFLSGMADGVDLYAAEEVLRLSVFCPEIRLVAVFPFGGGNSDRKRRLASSAYRAVSLGERYVTGCYAARNRFLVSHSVRLICGFGGDMSSGTGQTVMMAREQGLDVVILSL